MPRAAVVVPNRDGAGFLEECLRSVLAQTHPAEVIVVDDASNDGSLELVRERFPQATLLPLTANQGFAGAVNWGIAHALRQGAEYVALLNNDAVAEPDWLARLIAVADTHSDVGIVTSKLLRYDRVHIDSTGDFYSSWGWAYPRGRDEIDQGQYDAPEMREVFCGSGGASLFRSRMLEDVGLFDESYFAYLEDQDLGFRAQLRGWRARYEPRAVAYHHMMGTTGRLDHFGRYQAIRNCIYLYTINMPSPLWLKYLPKFLLGLFLMGLNDVRRRRFRAIAGAYGEALRQLPALAARRRRVQATRRVTVSYIDSILIHPLPPTQKTLLRVASPLRALQRGQTDTGALRWRA